MRIDARHRRRLLDLPTMPRFVKQTDEVRPQCQCGRRARAVTSQPWVTWYGPAVCPRCGRRTGLRARLRKIDPQWLSEHGIRSEAAYQSLLRERAELLDHMQRSA